MKQLVTALVLAAAAAGAFAADANPPAATPALGASKPLTAQQQKMSDCAAANKGKKGDDYKNGVKACLSGQPASAAKVSQQQKMSDCAKANKGKKGDEYKSAVKACLAS